MRDIKKLISYPAKPDRCDKSDKHANASNITISLVLLDQECNVILQSERLYKGDHMHKHISDRCIASYLMERVQSLIRICC